MSNLSPLFPEKVYHIYNHANGSENLFRTPENYRYFLQKYGEYINPFAETYAYCLMPNHFHLLVKIRSEEEILYFLRLKNPSLQGLETLEEFSCIISKQFSNLFNGYSQAYNKRYDRKGSLFIPRFKRKPVDNDGYLTQLIAYIHLNPVKHGFCKHMLDWEFSSIHAYNSESPGKLNRSYLTQWFGNKQAFIDFHNALHLEECLIDY